jgi:hypothetical protein
MPFPLDLARESDYDTHPNECHITRGTQPKEKMSCLESQLLRLVMSEPLDGVMKTVGCILVDSEISVPMHCVPMAVNSSSFIRSGHVSNGWKA